MQNQDVIRLEQDHKTHRMIISANMHNLNSLLDRESKQLHFLNLNLLHNSSNSSSNSSSRRLILLHLDR